MSGNGTDVAIRNVDTPLDFAVLEHVLGTGDLGKLTTQQRVAYYRQTCESLGLNYATRPFRFMSFQGQVVMYATRDAADQLRNIHKISLAVVNQKLDGDLFIVTVRATKPDGRTDEDMGAVTMGRLQGDARANAILKAITKAKRRVTLSICGLGFNDETEIETLPEAKTFDAEAEPEPPKVTPAPAPVTAPKTRSAAAVVDDIEARAQAATTAEDLNALERDDDVRKVREVLPIGRPQRDRLEALLTEHRARVMAFEQGQPDELDDVLDGDPPDGYARRVDEMIAMVGSAATHDQIDKQILGSDMATRIIGEITRQGRTDLIARIEAARQARLDTINTPHRIAE